MSLKDYRTDASDLPRENPDTTAPSALYQKDRNSLKIDRLAARVTFVTILLPILFGAMLFFIYLDMKDQVTGMDTVKESQVDHLARQMEEKMNALDIRIAKNRFELDEKLPALEKKSDSLAQQLIQLMSAKADIQALDDGFKKLETRLSRQDRRIQNNADQDQVNLAELERINATLLEAVAENRKQFGKEVQTLKQELTSLQALEKEMTSLGTLKQELAAIQSRLNDQQTALQSLEKIADPLEKQISDLEKQIMSRTEISRRLIALKSDVEQSLADLKKQIHAPPPLSIPDNISEQNLTQ
jgi:DNA repair exonuclease SbcCD ATPase subunit